jgi:hypothetical protein
MLTMTVRMTNNIRIQDTSATHVVTANLIMEVLPTTLVLFQYAQNITISSSIAAGEDLERSTISRICQGHVVRTIR